MTASEIDSEITRIVDIVREYDAKSDDCFAAGDVIRGVQYSRWATMALARAAELAARAARYNLARH